MVLWIDWQQDIEAWRGSVESRLEGLEEVTNLIPEILERLGPQTLAADHQRAVQKYVQQLHELTGISYGMIYDRLKTAFTVPRYADIPDLDWQQVVQWFERQLEQRETFDGLRACSDVRLEIDQKNSLGYSLLHCSIFS